MSTHSDNSDRSRHGIFSGWARRKRIEWFLPHVAPDAHILEVGCADGWFGRAAAARGYRDVTGLDLDPPADIVGDVRRWRELGLDGHSFDAVVAFEVIEHGDFGDALHDLLKPGGRLMVTTPVPGMDRLGRLLEGAGLIQRRSSPHSHLVDLRRLPRFRVLDRKVMSGISQWGILEPVY